MFVPTPASPIAVLIDAFVLKKRSVFALTVHGRLVEFILSGRMSSKSSGKDVFQETPAVSEFVVAFHPDPEFDPLAVMPAGNAISDLNELHLCSDVMGVVYSGFAAVLEDSTAVGSIFLTTAHGNLAEYWYNGSSGVWQWFNHMHPNTVLLESAPSSWLPMHAFVIVVSTHAA